MENIREYFAEGFRNRPVGSVISTGLVLAIIGALAISPRLSNYLSQRSDLEQTRRAALTVADTDRDGIAEENELEAMYNFLGKEYNGKPGTDLSKQDLEHFRDFYPIHLEYKNPSKTADY